MLTFFSCPQAKLNQKHFHQLLTFFPSYSPVSATSLCVHLFEPFALCPCSDQLLQAATLAKMRGGKGWASNVAFACVVTVSFFSVLTLPADTEDPTGNCGACSELRSSWKAESFAQVTCQAREAAGTATAVAAAAGRNLLGPGSYPPRCVSKCGTCAPCLPVHVPLPPGTTPITAEYYPEAWRCKCGSRLYMP